MPATTTNPTLADRLWPAAGGRGSCAPSCWRVAGSLLLWASAKIQVPFYPVPMTLQTRGRVPDRHRLWLAAGGGHRPALSGRGCGRAAGVRRHAGARHRPRPTWWVRRAATWLGFVAAAGIAGWVAERSRHWLATVGGLLAAHGRHLTSWALPGSPPSSGRQKAVTLGVLPFLLGDALKLALVAVAAEAGPEAAAGLIAGLIRPPTPAAIAEAATAPAPGRAGRLPDRDRLRPGCGGHQRRGGGAASTAPRAARRTTR